MSAHGERPGEAGGLPQAEVQRRRRVSPIWLAPALAIVLALWIVWRQLPALGPEIEILVADAAGVLANQTPVQRLGVTVGMVEDVSLHESGQVLLKARMTEEAEPFLRESTQFWVVRPQIGLGGVRQLDTLISGPYIGMRPGPGEPRTRFTAMERPPPDTGAPGLEVVLLAPQRGSLQVGTAVRYRGVEIGRITRYELQSDSRLINFHVSIAAPYTPLVRNNSMFWRSGGLNVDINLFGAEASAESLETLINGGVAMAVPNAAESPAEDGWQFVLHEEAEEEWLAWQPIIEIGPAMVEEAPAPEPALLEGVKAEQSDGDE